MISKEIRKMFKKIKHFDYEHVYDPDYNENDKWKAELLIYTKIEKKKKIDYIYLLSDNDIEKIYERMKKLEKNILAHKNKNKLKEGNYEKDSNIVRKRIRTEKVR